MTVPVETSTRRERGWVYGVSIAVLAVLVLVALLSFRSARQEAEAQDKAQELVDAMAAAGAEHLPSADRVAAVLGTDGGVACSDPASALGQAAIFAGLSNGATGPGYRPTIAESRAVQAELLIVGVYCPEHLEDVQAIVDDLDLAESD
ncbi:hypothetical protein [Cellulomonas sp. Y8]|uniref:hypothetical protein n=1 Tax=Cellulomonas sp. Y8 TaxID=2591145 RepID=UPI0011CC6F5B|nr:hypothetical protein [Cellulomonas sp. Y8]